MDNAVDDDGKGREEVGRVDLGVEEYLGSEEALVAYVDRDLAAAGLPDHVLGEAAAVAVEARELLDDVRAYIAVFLLDLLGGLQRAIRLSPVSQQGLYEIGDVTASDGNGLDGGADDVSFGDRDDVRDTITGIDNSAGQRAV